MTVHLEYRQLDHSERTVTMAAITWIALAGMMTVVAVGTLVVVSAYKSFAAFFPDLDFDRVQTPLSICAIAFGFCVEVILTVTGILVGYILMNRILHPSFLRLVNALGVTIGVASLLVVAAVFQLPGSLPLAGFLPLAGILIGSAILGGTILLVVLFLRSSLVRAASLHHELEEVV